MLCLMPDTQIAPTGIAGDTTLGPYPRLNPAAVDRAKTRLGITEIGSLGTALGFSRMGFWRVRYGQFDISYSHVLRVAAQLGWTVDRCFDLPGDRRD